VTKFTINLRQIGVFLRVLLFPPSINLTEILLKDIAKTHIDKYNYLCSIVFFCACVFFLFVPLFNCFFSVRLFSSCMYLCSIVFICVRVFLLFVPLFFCFHLYVCSPLVCAFILLFWSVCMFSSCMYLYSFALIFVCVYRLVCSIAVISV
jgi:hypothetical protein